MRTLTILAVVEVPDAIADRSDDELIDYALACWSPAAAASVTFVSVERGLSKAALAAGCEPPWEPEDERGSPPDPGREDFHSDG